MKFKVFTVKQKMLWFLMPLVIMVVLALTLLANQLTKNLLLEEYKEQRSYMESSARLTMAQIDAGYAMLDSQLEKDMTESVLRFKNLYEASGQPVDLYEIKERMGNAYDLVVIDDETTIIDTTLKEAMNFNFISFDPVLGEKINALRFQNDVVHERIRTNVVTGLLSKFSYVSAYKNQVLLEIVYNDTQFSTLVASLDPVYSMQTLADSNPIVEQIRVYDIYGYQFTNSGEKFEPTDESLETVNRAIQELKFETVDGLITKSAFYLSDNGTNPLSDHSRIIEITFNAIDIYKVINRLSMIVFGSGLFIMLIAIIVIYLFIKKITLPISKLSYAALSVAEGNYEIQVPIPDSELDEIGQLTHTFNMMTVHINNAYTEIENKLRTTLLSMGDGLISTNNQGEIEAMNKVAEELTGWSLDEARGKFLEDVFIVVSPVHESCEAERIMYEDNTIVYEWLRNRNGYEIPFEQTVSPLLDKNGDLHGQVIVFRDVTEQKEKLYKIEYLSYHDQLTGAFNRRYFEGAMKRLNRPENLPLTLVMVDVNGLKLINDAFGHKAGDKLLKKASELMERECRKGDVFSRIGGDEFVFLLPKTETEEAEQIMKKIYQESIEQQTDNLILSVSYGVATKVDVETPLNEIFKIAEDHMYRKKLSESLSMRYQMIEVVLKTLYEKNERERYHSERVSSLCTTLGLALGLEPDEVSELKSTGLMHDIGKIAIDLSLLDKPGSLSSAERLEIERHSEVGYQMLKTINEFSKISEYVLAHHEKWDGSGYPRNLKANEIPLQARIVAIADFYDAMSTNRPYRAALSHEAVIEALLERKGKDFDPELIDVFIGCLLNPVGSINA